MFDPRNNVTEQQKLTDICCWDPRPISGLKYSLSLDSWKYLMLADTQASIKVLLKPAINHHRTFPLTICILFVYQTFLNTDKFVHITEVEDPVRLLHYK